MLALKVYWAYLVIYAYENIYESNIQIACQLPATAS